MKRINLLFILLLSIVIAIVGCGRENITKDEPVVESLWEAYDWVEDAALDCFFNIVLLEDTTVNKEVLISNYYDNLFQDMGFEYPTLTDTSAGEMNFYRTISALVSTFSLGNEILIDKIDSLQYTPAYYALDKDEKVRVAVYAKTIIGVSTAIIESESNEKQGPRTSYNNTNGDTRYERQISSCMSYQLDGHFETLIGTIAYIGGLPGTLLVDFAVCNEEIIRGFWQHVE